MTTLHAIVYAIVLGFAQFLPIGADAHQALLPWLLGLQAPDPIFIGVLSFAAFLALFVHFRHDWASLISSSLQILIYRRRPMTIDERTPLFILLALIPLALGWYYLHEHLAEFAWTPPLIAGLLIAFAFPLGFFDGFSKSNKTMSDWNWKDALAVGLLHLTLLVPGAGLQGASLTGGLMRNYNREAAAKFGFYLALPILGAASVVQLRNLDFHAANPVPEMSWLTLVTAFVVCFFTSLLAVGGYMKTIQKKGLGQYVAYRILAGAAVLGFYWYRNR